MHTLIDNSKTDKNTIHSYLPTYQKIFANKKDTAKHILEIGICYGGSIKLWHDYFQNATIHALDIHMPLDDVWDQIKNNNRISVYHSDAYEEKFFNDNFLNKDIKFDIMIDDGPHTLESMKYFIVKYSQLLAEDGILIIEDVAEWEWIEVLKGVVPDNLTPYIETYDLRPNKNRYDDIVFVINRNKIIE